MTDDHLTEREPIERHTVRTDYGPPPEPADGEDPLRGYAEREQMRQQMLANVRGSHLSRDAADSLPGLPGARITGTHRRRLGTWEALADAGHAEAAYRPADADYDSAYDPDTREEELRQLGGHSLGQYGH